MKTKFIVWLRSQPTEWFNTKESSSISLKVSKTRGWIQLFQIKDPVFDIFELIIFRASPYRCKSSMILTYQSLTNKSSWLPLDTSLQQSRVIVIFWTFILFSSTLSSWMVEGKVGTPFPRTHSPLCVSAFRTSSPLVLVTWTSWISCPWPEAKHYIICDLLPVEVLLVCPPTWLFPNIHLVCWLFLKC